jgi:hypothetical protein
MKKENGVVYSPKVRLGTSPSGQMLLYVKFAGGESWLPKWSDVCNIFDKAITVENLNKKRIGKGETQDASSKSRNKNSEISWLPSRLFV